MARKVVKGTHQDDTTGQHPDGYTLWASHVRDTLGGSITANAVVAKGTPTDAYMAYQWHLSNKGQTGGTAGIDLNIAKAWADYTGAGVKIGILDDGFDFKHSDLAPNLSTTLDYDFRAKDATAQMEAGDYHGTLVAGVIGAAANNGGMAGVAYNATLVGYRMGFGNYGGIDQIVGGFQAAKANVDVLNNSWGFTTPYADTAKTLPTVVAALNDLAINGRGGLGTAIVFAAGNSGAADNTNYHVLTNSPYTITVGALDANGKAASFTTPGASVLVSAPGVSVATDDGVGATGAVSGDYAIASGTSFAAPMVSGVIGLMLQANKNLGARDIQEILAISAKQTDLAGAGWQSSAAAFVNGGALKYSHTLGFGLVDATAAVRLAEGWTAGHTFKNVDTLTATSTAKATITDGGAIASKIAVASDIVIDRVEVTANITHARGSDLELYLVAPDGSRSILADNAATTGAYGSGFTYSTVEPLGQFAGGTWTLEVRDTVTGTVGTLDSWSIKFTGSKDTVNDTYYFTDAYSAYTKTGYTVKDTDGGLDTLNATATSANNTIIMQTGYASTIAGRLTYVGSEIEHARLGDGNDTLYGNASANSLYAGRGNDGVRGGDGNDLIYGQAGNDVLYGDNGNDWIYGGAGLDALYGGAGKDRFVIDTLDGAVDRVMDFDKTADVLDLSALLTGFKATDNLANWLSVSQSGTDTIVSVAQTGNHVYTAAAALANTNAATLDLALLVKTDVFDLTV